MNDLFLVRAINEGIQNNFTSLVDAVVCAHKSGKVVVHSNSGNYWVVSFANALVLVEAGYSIASLPESQLQVNE
ncbi:hypothetical protein GCM10023189_04060 [Nibrella saemangeumensis]|uniref:Uncharacterized protein n=1 Tax=Nibrella saemangeumensis TaxID=1084526 RepID=A0ABP8MDY6_9BACT